MLFLKINSCEEKHQSTALYFCSQFAAQENTNDQVHTYSHVSWSSQVTLWTQTSLMAMGGLSSVAKFWRLDLNHPNNRGAYCSPVVFAGAVSIAWAVEKSWQLWCTYVCVMKTLQVFFALKAYCMHKQTDTFTKCSCQYIRCTYIPCDYYHSAISDLEWRLSKHPLGHTVRCVPTKTQELYS